MATNSFAVIIGVSDYSGYRGSHRDDMPGSLNDARAWEHIALDPEVLGMPRENIRVLADGPDGPIDTREGAGAPTKENIERAIRWLAKKLVDAGGSSDEQDAFGPVLTASGLVTFSGHGFAKSGLSSAPLGSTLYIAPQDVRQVGSGVPDNALSLLSLNRILVDIGKKLWPETGVSHGVTWAIDACYSIIPSAAEDPGESSLLAMWGKGMYGRVMLGSRPWGDTWQTRAGTGTRGAFSLALTTLIQQWRPRQHRGVQYIAASYGDLMSRTRDMLGALGVAQRPVLVGLPRLELLAFLYPGNDISPTQTTAEPDGPRVRGQIGSDTEQIFRTFELSVLPADGSSPVKVGVVVQSSQDAQVNDGRRLISLYAGGESMWRWGIPAGSVDLDGGRLRVKLIKAGTTWSDFTDMVSQDNPFSGAGVHVYTNTMIGNWTTPPVDSAGNIDWSSGINASPEQTLFSAPDSNVTPGVKLRFINWEDNGQINKWLKYVYWATWASSTPPRGFFQDMGQPDGEDGTTPTSKALTADLPTTTAAAPTHLRCGQTFNSAYAPPQPSAFTIDTKPASPAPTGLADKKVRYAFAYLTYLSGTVVSPQSPWSPPIALGTDQTVEITPPSDLREQALLVLRQVIDPANSHILSTQVVSGAGGWAHDAPLIDATPASSEMPFAFPYSSTLSLP